MKKNTLDELFAPKSIAIVGASNKKGKIGAVLVENITKLGYKGEIHFVNPSYKFLKLKRCFSTLSDINREIDLAIIAVPAKFVQSVIREGSKNVKNFVVISAGFSEIGSEGKKQEAELAEMAKKYGVNILGPNCLGFINPRIKLNASFAGGMPNAGNIAFVSQSGALAVALMDRAEGEHIGFSHVISIGNKMQIDETALLEFLAKDKETKVIGMYLEGIKNGQKFLEIAEKIAHIKPVVILKAGKTAKAQKAIASHTGALAGADEIVDSAFAKVGIIRAKDLEEFFDLLTLISFTALPVNKNVAVITNAGGAGVLTTDAFKNKEISLFDFDQKTKKQLRSFLPEEGSVENPVDLLGDATQDRYENALSVIEKQKIGSVICVLTPQQQTPVMEIANTIISQQMISKASIVSVFIGGQRVAEAINKLKKHNIPNFSNPDSAVCALDKYLKWGENLKRKYSSKSIAINISRKKEIADIYSQAIENNQKALLFMDSARIMKMYGIESGECFTVMPEESAPKIKNFPLVLKVDSDKVIHKSDMQGIILNINNMKMLSESVSILQNNFPQSKLLIQHMQEKQIEIILGIKKDAIFGPVIVYGLGGIYTEIFKMVDFLIPPLSLFQIKEEILKGKLGFLFTGARGQKTYDLEEFAKIVLGLMQFSKEADWANEFDINPLFIYNDGRGALAVDIKIIL